MPDTKKPTKPRVTPPTDSDKDRAERYTWQPGDIVVDKKKKK